MDVSLRENTYIGMGTAALADPFQSGREAAQMAKKQLLGHSGDLVLAMGPSNVHFQDFVEGVRLVTGEDVLIGIPTPRLFTHDISSAQACAVAIIRSDSVRFTLSNGPLSSNPLNTITAIFTQLRERRGNTRYQFEYHGILAFIKNGANQVDGCLAAKLMCAEAGLESWMVKTDIPDTVTSPLMCSDQILSEGIIALECMSQQSFGFGVVGIEAFKNHENIVAEAIKTALRGARTQMEPAEPAMGIIFLNFASGVLFEHDIDSLVQEGFQKSRDIPLVGMITQNPFVRFPGRSDWSKQESVAALMIPK